MNGVAMKFPEIISLLDLKGAMRLDRSKDMSVHVLTCRNYELNALRPVVWKLWRSNTVFLRLVAKMDDRFLEQ
jgi:hypothetical protein